MPKITHLRQEYHWGSLLESDLNNNPLTQFDRWFNEAVQKQCYSPDAVTLTTAGKDAQPDARMVLLKSFDDEGFIFCTNLNSAKAHQLTENPQASLLFFWRELERQVRIKGTVVRIDDKTADSFFAERPLLAQIAACASNQSQPIENRSVLEDRFKQKKEEFENHAIPRPLFWGGYKVIPHAIEFWQGRENRLHDRILYTKTENSWSIQRLQP